MYKALVFTISVATFLVAYPATAHPGNTASDGCHYCRTNCAKWGEVSGARHCHSGGYSVPRLQNIQPKENEYVSDFISAYNDNIPLIVENLFGKVYGRNPYYYESQYWKDAIRIGLPDEYGYGIRFKIYTRSGLEKEMVSANNIGSTGPSFSIAPAQSLNEGNTLAAKINSLFREVYGRNPSVSENKYWLLRITDKPTEQAIKGAMAFHKANGINH